MKDKELALLMKQKSELKKLETLEKKLNKLKEAPVSTINLGKDSVQNLKNRVKQLEIDKKNLKQQVSEMQ